MMRRHFLEAATACVLLPAAAGSLAAPLVRGAKELRYAFFDERFQAAIRLSESWSGLGVPIGVQGDVTELWRSELERVSFEQRLYLRGVTTQSFLFCLRILAAEQAQIDARVSRLDRDLFLWSMYTIPRNMTTD